MKYYYGVIYKITNNYSKKVYIGQSSNFKRRYQSYKYYSKKPRKNSKIELALYKYGFDNFIFEILMECETKSELNYMEKYFISYYDSINFGYNIQKGGTSIGKHSEESKKKMSEKRKGKHNSPRTEFDGSMCGEKHPGSKLTNKEVEAIREEYITTYTSQRKLAKKYNISLIQIQKILNYDMWKISDKPDIISIIDKQIIDLILHENISIRAISKKYKISFGVIKEIFLLKNRL